MLVHQNSSKECHEPGSLEDLVRSLRELHQGRRNSGICKQNPYVSQPSAPSPQTRNAQTRETKTDPEHINERVSSILYALFQKSQFGKSSREVLKPKRSKNKNHTKRKSAKKNRVREM